MNRFLTLTKRRIFNRDNMNDLKNAVVEYKPNGIHVGILHTSRGYIEAEFNSNIFIINLGGDSSYIHGTFRCIRVLPKQNYKHYYRLFSYTQLTRESQVNISNFIIMARNQPDRKVRIRKNGTYFGHLYTLKHGL